MNEEQNKLLNMFIQYLQIEKDFSPYTVEFYTKDIKNFFLFMNEQGIEHVENVEYFDVRLYLTKLYNDKLSRKSVARKISSLRSFFKFLLKEKIIQENPFSYVSIPKIEKRLPDFFYEEEIRELFKACAGDTPLDQRNQVILEILYGTGIRVSELCNIRLQDIDLDLSVILIHGKGKKLRYVPFGSFAQDALVRYLQDGRKKILKNSKQDHEFLLVNYRGGKLTPRGVATILNQIIEKSSLHGNIHPHKLRHTFATHLLNNGADMRIVQELLGHENLSTTQVYTHVTKGYLRNIYMNHHPRA